jgi:hypothetical protein
MGLTKGQPGDLHQYFCRVLEQIASLFSFVDYRWCFGGRQLEVGWQARRDEPSRVGTLQHAEQIKLGNVYCKFGPIGVRPARRGTSRIPRNK